MVWPTLGSRKAKEQNRTDSKFKLGPHHVWKYGRHPIGDR